MLSSQCCALLKQELNTVVNLFNQWHHIWTVPLANDTNTNVSWIYNCPGVNFTKLWQMAKSERRKVAGKWQFRNSLKFFFRQFHQTMFQLRTFAKKRLPWFLSAAAVCYKKIVSVQFGSYWEFLIHLHWHPTYLRFLCPHGKYIKTCVNNHFQITTTSQQWPILVYINLFINEAKICQQIPLKLLFGRKNQSDSYNSEV